MMDKTTVCRICQGTSLKEVMDFGEVALAGGFLEPGMFHMEQRHHLRIGMCTECATVQVVDHPKTGATIKWPAEAFSRNKMLFEEKWIN